MHTRFLFILIAIATITACTPKEVRFFREGAFADFELLLYADSTFHHISHAKPPMYFNEKGSWLIQDSLLVLCYTNSSYSIDCSVFLLQNDTFLISTYQESVFLYPIQSRHNAREYSYQEMMESLLKLYNNKTIKNSIGIDFYVSSKNTFEAVFGQRKTMISEYYDRFIDVNILQH